ncbi:MAG: hypothetical protein E7267_03010 [Lachnospiraceae bacterium]|nr:hypothetical protein [Lachnospiraceae bacterium]
MKKTYFLSIALIAFALIFISNPAMANAKNTGIKIDKSNFPNRSIRHYVKDADKNGDGILQEKENRELKQVGITCPNDWKPYKKVDLKGLSLLKHVESFYFGLDKEDSEKVVNFNELYKLKKLKRLTLSCAKLNIETIDISKFPNLEFLCLGSLNELRNITFGGNDNLKEVEIRYTKNLKKLDFSKLTNLRKLTMEDVAAEDIKFDKNNRTIRRLSIFTFYKRNTHYSELDLSKLKKLKKLYLQDCNKITSLDLSGNTNLEELILDGADKIQKIDFTHNNKLKILCLAKTGIHNSNIAIPDDNCLESVKIFESKNITEFDTDVLKADLITDLYFDKTPLKKLDASKFYNLERISTAKKTKVIYPADGHDYKIVNP